MDSSQGETLREQGCLTVPPQYCVGFALFGYHRQRDFKGFCLIDFLSPCSIAFAPTKSFDERIINFQFLSLIELTPL